MIPNKKHQTFADEYILTNDAIVSYQKAYPNAKTESARVESYRILQDPTISDYIKQKQLEIQNARQNNVIEQLKAKDSSNILTREKIVEMTSNVVKITYNTYVKSKDKADADAFNKSVAVFNKLEGLDASTKIEQTINDKRQGFIEYEIE
jgi:hypothetical protein